MALSWMSRPERDGSRLVGAGTGGGRRRGGAPCWWRALPTRLLAPVVTVLAAFGLLVFFYVGAGRDRPDGFGHRAHRTRHGDRRDRRRRPSGALRHFWFRSPSPFADSRSRQPSMTGSSSVGPTTRIRDGARRRCVPRWPGWRPTWPPPANSVTTQPISFRSRHRCSASGRASGCYLPPRWRERPPRPCSCCSGARRRVAHGPNRPQAVSALAVTAGAATAPWWRRWCAGGWGGVGVEAVGRRRGLLLMVVYLAGRSMRIHAWTRPTPRPGRVFAVIGTGAGGGRGGSAVRRGCRRRAGGRWRSRPSIVGFAVTVGRVNTRGVPG